MHKLCVDSLDLIQQVYYYFIIFPLKQACCISTSCCGNPVDAVAYSFAYFGQGYGGIFLDNVACSGTDNMLVDCIRSSSIGVHNCQHNDDAGVSCQGMFVLKERL